MLRNAFLFLQPSAILPRFALDRLAPCASKYSSCQRTAVKLAADRDSHRSTRCPAACRCPLNPSPRPSIAFAIVLLVTADRPNKTEQSFLGVAELAPEGHRADWKRRVQQSEQFQAHANRAGTCRSRRGRISLCTGTTRDGEVTLNCAACALPPPPGRQQHKMVSTPELKKVC